ncbi:hypothetical protein SAMN04487911_1587 [Arenibacter nanhaiticus]|uniref:Uncharacterized protein n=1 Tax=Arenibacter nanhaiticus TaxID=558155 RepID=A0A1M6N8G1_9FLAO|nr:MULTISPECIES: hypothetical protein [Arenibacter]NKI28198.1 hypothetical protein [Arenibacter sp. 6A1]SHJ91998.1 hypothetical protein SAMN04487911_1587 [Arenibacter nanhaiticus]
MKEDNKNIEKKKRELSKADIERLEIIQKSEEVKGEQLSINIDSELTVENEALKLLGKTIDDPVEKFQLYYHGLTKLLKDNLPKGKENEQVRRIVYDEKNILINRGAKKDEKGIRGSDGRMAYIEDLEFAIQIVADWISKKGSASDLFMAFWDKNEELGYEHQD